MVVSVDQGTRVIATGRLSHLLSLDASRLYHSSHGPLPQLAEEASDL